MDDLGTKLEGILNNPQAMSQIMSLAQSLGGKNAAPEPAPPPEPQPAPTPSGQSLDFNLDPKILSGLASLLNSYNSDDDQRIALLNALRPFVKEQRYTKIDKAVQIAKLSRMVRMALELFRTREDGHV